MPMSTTWVFLGLLAGREVAMTWQSKQSQSGNRNLLGTAKLVGMDAFKAFAGLAVSVLLALAGIRLAG